MVRVMVGCKDLTHIPKLEKLNSKEKKSGEGGGEDKATIALTRTARALGLTLSSQTGLQWAFLGSIHTYIHTYIHSMPGGCLERKPDYNAAH